MGEYGFRRVLYPEIVQAMIDAKHDLVEFDKDDGSPIGFCIPEGTDAIANDAFRGMKTLEYVVIPDTVQAIGRNAFEGCSAIEKVDIPESVEYISNSAFFDCDSLRKVTLHEGVREINSFAFGNCPKLWRVKLPKSLKRRDGYGVSKMAFCGSSCNVNFLAHPAKKLRRYFRGDPLYHAYRQPSGIDIC